MATVTERQDSDTGIPAPARTPLRVRQPAALIRFLLGLAAVCLTLLLADHAQATAGGLDADVAQGAGLVPRPVAGIAGALSTAALLLVPAASAGWRLLGREGRRGRQQVADGLLAAVLAYGASVALDLWADGPAAASLLTSLTHPLPGGGHTEPVYGYLAPVLGFLVASAARERRLPRAVLALSGAAGLIAGYASPLSVVLAVLIGWTTAHGTLYAIGVPDPRPLPEQLLRSLRQVGLRPSGVSAAGPDRYLVRQHDGRPDLDVLLLDRQALVAALFQRVWRRLRLRTAPHPRVLRSLRTGLEHEALVSYAAVAAGVRTRKVAATAELGPDAALVAYESLPGRTLAELADEELTDALVDDVWAQFKLLQTRQISHRALVSESVLVTADGAVHLVDLADGDIAASELVLRVDVAQLLTTLALRVGAERAVRRAVAVLGPDAVGSALPLLQPIALARPTRAALKEQGELLDAIRAEVLRTRPQAPVAAVRLERLRPRTLLAVVGGVVAGCLLLPQFFATDHNPIATMVDADPGWTALAVLAAAASHLAATMGFVGFVPERLHLGRAALTQVAGCFVKLVSPGGVGGVALNTRFLQRSGIPTAQALSSVGVGQLLGLILHLLQLGAFVYLLGRDPGEELTALPALVGGLGGAALLLALVFAVPQARRWLAARLRPLTAEVLPRLLDLLRSPGRLAVGIAGQLLVSLCLVACLYCCALAVGERPGFSSVAVALLIGNAVGSAAPTPGGVGAIDVALPNMLTATAAMTDSSAFAAVVLYRLLTFLLPVLPGWAAFAWLQRRRAL
ncbi:lysylphosphatidylglycerol synthase domain-containing protein [Kitasatospora sp. NPDC050543]|uniref:lysylphosphatidylglycerol synthase domain-containing protein n=1 Tax=Kitasatospora sp. NPDC050543 TaxID=3364054 RepID=UPI0037B4E712